MFKNVKGQFIVVLAIGALIGYAIASHGFEPSNETAAATSAPIRAVENSTDNAATEPAAGAASPASVCLSEGLSKGQLLAMADEPTAPAGAGAAIGSVQTTGVIGTPGATTTINGKQLPPPDPKFGGVIKERASESKPWWPPRVVPPKGAPNVLLIMTDDVGFGAPGTFGGVVPTPGTGSHREERAAVHQFPLHVALLAHARGDDHRPQPSRRRLRRGGRDRDRVPGLRLDHPEGERHHRRNPEGERVRDLVVRQGSQHALLPGDPGRTVRAMAERHGLRILLRLRRRRHQPVAAEPIPQHDGHLSLPGQRRAHGT